MRILTSALGVATALLVLAACGGDGGEAGTPAASVPKSSPASTPTDAPPASTSPTPEPETSPGDRADLPPFPKNTKPQQGENDQVTYDKVFTGVRVAAHEGFDRIVLDFTGTGKPGWFVSYVPQARLEGSGKRVRLAGDSILQVVDFGSIYPEADQYYDGPKRIRPTDGGDVEEVYVGGTFEGSTQIFVGLDGPRAPFRVFGLADPPRLVVDVADR